MLVDVNAFDVFLRVRRHELHVENVQRTAVLLGIF
jgi:hypothetical protein